MSLRIYSHLIFICLLFLSCSDNPSDSGDDNSENIQNEINFNLKVENTEIARPGGFVIASVNVDRITQDSLTGFEITWESNYETLELERQNHNTVATFIPENFKDDELTLTASVSKPSYGPSFSGNENKNSKSITVDLQNDPIPAESLQGYITEDRTLNEEKVYRLTKDIALENESILTVKSGAILDLNGHAILGNNGVLNLEGLKDQKVYLITGKTANYERIESNFKANHAFIMRVDNAGTTVVGNSEIANSNIYGNLVVNNSSIINSQIFRLTHVRQVRSSEPFSMEIKNSTIYQLYLKDFYTGSSLSSQNNSIFIFNFDNVSELNTTVSDNNISFLSISGTSGQSSFKNNFISRLFINDNWNSSVQENNIGLLTDGFYKKDDEPFWQPVWGSLNIKQLNGPIVQTNSSGQFEVQDLNLSNNYWAPELLKEIKEKGPSQNISFIYDHYDDESLDKIIYKGWSETEFN